MLADEDLKQRDALVERLFGATIGALELLHVYLGDRLGLYDVLSDGPLTPAGLATAARISERYAREWLEQQAVEFFRSSNVLMAAKNARTSCRRATPRC